MEDRALLDAFRRGERSALEEVFRDYAPKVAHWLGSGFQYHSRDGRQRFAGFRSPADAHDAMQEIFRLAFEKRARVAYSGLSAYEGYLFATTRNVVLKKLRLQARQSHFETEQIDRLVSPDPSPEARVSRAQEQLRVRAYLATVSDEERRFAQLRFVEGQSQEQVGQSMGWSRKKVRLEERAFRKSMIRFLKRTRGRAERGEVANEGAY